MKNSPVYFITACVILCLIFSGCVASTQEQEGVTPSPSTPLTPKAPSTSSSDKDPTLPEMGRIDMRGLTLLRVIFRTQLNVNQLDSLYGTTRGQVEHLCIVSNGELDVLKAFVAQRWAPLVLLKYGNNVHLWSMMGYDDGAQQFQLGNPVTGAIRLVSYADFEQEWRVGSRKKCVLVTPLRLTQAKVHSVLGKYLPTSKISEVAVRGR